jgi:hypothetical protein
VFLLNSPERRVWGEVEKNIGIRYPLAVQLDDFYGIGGD